jgi:hypothetical protein
MRITQQYYGHHFVVSTLIIMLLVGGMVSYLAFVYTQSYFIALDKEMDIPKYNLPVITMTGEIQGELPDNHGYIFHEVLSNGEILDFAAIYQEATSTKFKGVVVIKGKFLGSTCAYKTSFEGKCVNAIEIDEMKIK